MKPFKKLLAQQDHLQHSNIYVKLGGLLVIRLYIHAVKELFDAVVKVLQDIEEEDGKAGADAAVLLKSISTFSFFFKIVSLDAVFHVVNILSVYLQKILLHTHELGHTQNLFWSL